MSGTWPVKPGHVPDIANDHYVDVRNMASDVRNMASDVRNVASDVRNAASDVRIMARIHWPCS